MKITDIVIWRIRGSWTGPGFPPGNQQIRPIDLYPEFFRPVDSGKSTQERQQIEALYVEIETAEGVSGLFGPIQEPQAFIIDTVLRPFLMGRDPLATELLFDQMLRLDRHGRSGTFMTAVSPLDCALWDLKGKAWGQPVYRLLGGPTRPAMPAYASMLGFSTEPTEAARLAQEYQEKGFTAQKWFFRYGPAQGEAGKAQNIALAQAVREAVGPHYELMFDAFMGWDVNYAIEIGQALAPLKPTWLEEPIPPERIGSLRKIRAATNIPIATGEHVYTRWQVKELLVGEAVDILQTDPDWTGGISELTKICALTSAFEVPLIAHGHSLLPALHVAAAQSPATVPRVEFLIRAQESKQFFHQPIYRPEAGAVGLPTLPGLGLVWDDTKIETRERVRY